MAEDQQGNGNSEKSYESTLEVNKEELMAEIARDRSKPATKKSESRTVKMPAVESDTKVEHNPLLAAEEEHDESRTIPMPAVSEAGKDNQETTNFSVPDELLQQISQSDDENRWETMEIVIEELEDSEVSEVSEVSYTHEDEPAFVLEKIEDPTDQTFDGELSSKRTSPVLYRMEFQAVVNEDGTLSIPDKYLQSGHVRAGMKFKIEAIGLRDDD